MGSGRVLGDVHHGEIVVLSEPHRVHGRLEQPVDVPALDVLADGAGADEDRSLDGKACPLLGLGDGEDVGGVRTPGTIGLDVEAGPIDLLSKPYDIVEHPAAGARIADVGEADPEGGDLVDDLDLLGQRGLTNRWALQPVAQRLVVEFHLGRRRHFGFADQVPIVEKFLLLTRIVHHRALLRSALVGRRRVALVGPCCLRLSPRCARPRSADGRYGE